MLYNIKRVSDIITRDPFTKTEFCKINLKVLRHLDLQHRSHLGHRFHLNYWSHQL